MNARILNLLQPAFAPAEDARNKMDSTLCSYRAIGAPKGRTGTVLSWLDPGQHVRIRAGTFAGFEGTILKCGNHSRCVIALHLERSGVFLELDKALLEVIG